MTKGDLVFIYDTLVECAAEVRRDDRLELIGSSLRILEDALADIGVELGYGVEITDEESEDPYIRYRDEAELGMGLGLVEGDDRDESDSGAWEDDLLGGEVA